MAVVTALAQILGIVYAILLPGVLLLVLTRAVEGGLWRRLAVGGFVGAVAMPMLGFSVAWLLGTNLSPSLVLAVGSVVNGSLGAALALRHLRGGREGRTR